MKVVCITPTRNRIEQLRLVKVCLENQTRKPDEWIIGDDSDIALSQSFLEASFPVTNVHCDHLYDMSICYNAANALQRASGDVYIIIQDDDYYPKTYIENILNYNLKPDCMIGNCHWIDYRLSTQHYRVQYYAPHRMPEFHQTVFVGENIKNAATIILANNPGFKAPDHAVFGYCSHLRFPYFGYDFAQHTAISLKDYGVGTPGVVPRHRSDKGLTSDPDGSKFKQLLGDDWIRYQKYLGWRLTTE